MIEDGNVDGFVDIFYDKSLSSVLLSIDTDGPRGWGCGRGLQRRVAYHGQSVQYINVPFGALSSTWLNLIEPTGEVSLSSLALICFFGSRVERFPTRKGAGRYIPLDLGLRARPKDR